MATRYLGHEMIVVGPGVRTGHGDPLRQPARARAPTASSTPSRPTSGSAAPCIVVDFGTAITYDAVSRGRRVPRRDHRAGRRDLDGGADRARGQAAEDRPRSRPRSLIGKSTVDAIRSGVDLRLRRARSTASSAACAPSSAPTPTRSPPAASRSTSCRSAPSDRRGRRPAHAHRACGCIHERNARRRGEAATTLGPVPTRALTDSWTLGGVRVPNRVVLAPLAGIGNWFVRLQAKRYGAGLVVSEMVSSFAIHYRNERTCREMLRDPPRASTRCRSSSSATTRTSCARRPRRVARGRRGPDRPQHGLPGAEGLQDRRRRGAAARSRPRGRRRARRRARAAGCRSPSSCAPASGRASATASSSPTGSWRRRASPASPSTRATPPSSTRARRTTTSRASSSRRCPVPVILSGGLRDAEPCAAVFERTGAAAVMLARGSLGNPWLFEQVLGTRRERARRATRSSPSSTG